MTESVLRTIYERYGEEAIFNTKKLRALLLDMRVSKKTINLLSDISRVDYFKQFTQDIISDETAREKLIYNTENEYAFERGAVEYGVDCWVCAITGRASAKELEPIAAKEPEGDIWPEETAELVAAALRELMKEQG